MIGNLDFSLLTFDDVELKVHFSLQYAGLYLSSFSSSSMER